MRAIMVQQIEFRSPENVDKNTLEKGEIFAPRFDANGLITVVVVDHASRALLMVAHMNAEALEKTITSGMAHYWSRSRSRLWQKGEQSGNTQQVVEIRTDCDQDVIELRVVQRGTGAACHTGRFSCFYRRVENGNKGVRLTMDQNMQPAFDPQIVYGRNS